MLSRWRRLQALSFVNSRKVDRISIPSSISITFKTSQEISLWPAHLSRSFGTRARPTVDDSINDDFDRDEGHYEGGGDEARAVEERLRKLKKSKTDMEAEGRVLQKYHKNYFYNPEIKSTYDVRSGTYQDISEVMKAKYFPEGFAGEFDEEIEHTGQTKWMIRDTTKLIYRLIEESEKRLNHDGDGIYLEHLEKLAQHDQQQQPSSSSVNNNNSDSSSSNSKHSKGLHTVVDLPRLTDRNEWSTAIPQLSYYGKEMTVDQGIGRVVTPTPADQQQQPSSTAAAPAVESFEVTRGPGSWLEGTVEKLLTHCTQPHTMGLPDRLILTGGRGTGKSIVLNQTVLYARQRGWLALFVPEGWDQVQSGPYIQPVATTASTATATASTAAAQQQQQQGPPKEFWYKRPKKTSKLQKKLQEEALEARLASPQKQLYDNPYMTKVVLRGFWKAHHKQLKHIPLKYKEDMMKYDKLLKTLKTAWLQGLSVQGREKLPFIAMRAIVKADEHYAVDDPLDEPILKNYDFQKMNSQAMYSLEDLVLLGIAASEVTGLTFLDLVRELRELTSHPVLVAVDQYNSWLVDSAFSFNYTAIAGRELVVPSALSFFAPRKKQETLSYTIKHGLCLAATSFRHNEGKDFVFDDVKDSLPLRVKVPYYNQREYLSALSYYLNYTPLGSTLTMEDFLVYRMHTSSIPRLVRIECSWYFFPRQMFMGEDEIRLASILGSAMEDEDGTGGGAEEEETGGGGGGRRGRAAARAAGGDGDEDEDEDAAAMLAVDEDNEEGKEGTGGGKKGGKQQAAGGKGGKKSKREIKKEADQQKVKAKRSAVNEALAEKEDAKISKFDAWRNPELLAFHNDDDDEDDKDKKDKDEEDDKDDRRSK